MLNTNNTVQTRTSNALHNAIMEAGGKDPLQLLAPEGSSETTTEWYMKHYKNVSKDIKNLLNDEAEAVYTILTGIDNNIYSTVDACPNAMEIKFTSRDGESLESYYSRFYKMMNELVRNKREVTNHQVNVQFLLQLQPEWQRFVTHVKQSQELKTISYQKLYDIMKQHQNKVNKIRAERLARTANPLVFVDQQQPVYHPQPHFTHYTHYTQNSSTRSQQAVTINRGKAIVNSPPPTYDQEPDMITEDNAFSKETEIDKLMALIFLSFKKIYKPTNNNLRTSSNTSRSNQDNTLRINKGIGECHKPKWAKDSAYHKEKMLLSNERQHLEQPESVNDTYLNEQGDTNITTDLVDMSTNGEEADQDDDDLTRERDFLAFLIEKLKCEIDDNKNYNKLLESSDKTLVDKLKSEIEDFKNKNKCLESSNNYFKEANTKLAKNNQLMFKDIKKFQAELDSFIKPEFLKKARRVNPRLYDIGFYNDNLALMLAPESDKTIPRRDNSDHRRLWVLKAHDGKSQDSKNDLLIGSRGTDLYSITLQNTTSPNRICLMAKASSS
ncbi:hypothetical protein Tco_1105848 [Tanacetum coccineum]